jgi:molybdopterin-guanine dinucleotide biosynthesis protein A
MLAVILAGGQSRRLGGGDKCLLPVGARSILDYTLDRVRPQAEHVVISANGDPARFRHWGLPVIGDAIPDWRGPLVGILSAMEWAGLHLPQVRDILSVPADMPLVPRDLCRALQEGRAASGLSAAVASADGRLNPLVGLWPVDEAKVLRSAITEDGLARAELWARRASVAVVPLRTNGSDPFFNINTAEDLAAAPAVLEAAGACSAD